MPALHAAQRTWPACDWYLPTPQGVQELTAAPSEYVPTPHAVHDVAPTSVPVFVIEPAPHCMHDVLPATPAYVPA